MLWVSFVFYFLKNTTLPLLISAVEPLIHSMHICFSSFNGLWSFRFLGSLNFAHTRCRCSTTEQMLFFFWYKHLKISIHRYEPLNVFVPFGMCWFEFIPQFRPNAIYFYQKRSERKQKRKFDDILYSPKKKRTLHWANSKCTDRSIKRMEMVERNSSSSSNSNKDQKIQSEYSTNQQYNNIYNTHRREQLEIKEQQMQWVPVPIPVSVWLII